MADGEAESRGVTLQSELLSLISLAPDPGSPAGARNKPPSFSLLFVLFPVRSLEVSFFFFTPRKFVKEILLNKTALLLEDILLNIIFFILLRKDLHVGK